MISNKPSFNELIQWAWDYNVVSFNAGTFVETYTYKVRGTFDPATKVYSGGLDVGYVYMVYDDALKSNYVSSYGRKA